MKTRDLILFAFVAGLIVLTGFLQSWNTALKILNMGMISAIMAVGVNIQWGFAGLFNVGTMGFVALGGLAVVITSAAPVPAAWDAGGPKVVFALLLAVAMIVGAVMLWRRVPVGRVRAGVMAAYAIAGFFIYRALFDSAVQAIEAVDPSTAGYLGGLGLPVLLSWPVGAALAAAAAWVIGKTALGLRSDYLAIATLGISEIVISILKNEDWLNRGVKNVIGLPRPVPYEIDLQQSVGFAERAAAIGLDPVTASTLFVKLCYSALFGIVLALILWGAQMALKSPWGRMMRAIRDNEVAASAMGKDVTYRHLQVFVIGSAICGLAGAMMTTLDGQLTPTSYQPLRFTFLIWVMVIVGGSGNNFGAVLGGFLIWFFWVQAEPLGKLAMETLTAGMAGDSPLRAHLIDSVAYMRLLSMGVILLLVLRFSPRGLIPER